LSWRAGVQRVEPGLTNPLFLAFPKGLTSCAVEVFVEVEPPKLSADNFVL
jgi:hypothetical protein